MSVVHARRSSEHTGEHACQRKRGSNAQNNRQLHQNKQKRSNVERINNTLIIYFQYNKLECFENTVERFLERKKIKFDMKTEVFGLAVDVNGHEFGYLFHSTLVQMIRLG